ncbi:MAG: choice-of-anchor V domain-containing protein [Gemmatimonadota bacterium]
MRSTDVRGGRSRDESHAFAAGVLFPVLPLVLLGLTIAPGASGSAEADAGAARDIAWFADRAYLTGPPPGHTGGFGEPDCTACHFDAPVNPEGGELRVEGLPDRYAPGASYRLRVTLEVRGLGRAGFQLAARFGEGNRRGASAGTLTAKDSTVQVVRAEGDGGNGAEEVGDAPDVHYAQHTRAGTGQTARTSPARYAWTVRWKAPEEPEGPVLFHAAANAANDDASEFGDRIFTLETAVDPPEGG